MGLTPSGIWSQPLDLLHTLLSECVSVQELFGAATAEEAKALITLVGADESTYTLPCIVIGAGSYEVQHIGTGPTYRDGGTLYLGIDTPISSEYLGAGKYGDAEYEHTNTVGAILEEMMQLANDGGYLLVQSFSCASGPVRSDPKERVQYYQSIWELRWGLAR